MFIPGSEVQTEINDVDLIESPLFWLFLSTVAILKISIVAAIVMEDTICVQLLGKKLFIILLLWVFNLNLFILNKNFTTNKIYKTPDIIVHLS